MSNDIERFVQAALYRLYDRDAEILRNDVNERTITHKLAEYLEPEFPGWNVDCEYNRNHDQTKKLQSLRGDVAPIDDTDGISVFPDIIVHKRITDENLLVIEVKKSTSRKSPDFDKQKLLAFKEELNYQHALFLQVTTGKNELSAKLEWM
ncbi:MAG: hypothetical protein NPIRA03_40640 [Nitrospirales bacterium]|nr:MAG: hypothetical protein NPIRA03_40640 [Nitrospirales bacterium]